MSTNESRLGLESAASAVFRNPDAMYGLKEAAVAVMLESDTYTVSNSALRTVVWFALGVKYKIALEAFWEGFDINNTEV